MSPHAADCERPAPVHVHPGGRVAPRGARPPPARAWTERDHGGLAPSPGETRRLLASAAAPASPPHRAPARRCRLQAGLTLGVWGKRGRTPLPAKDPLAVKTRYQQKKDKWIATLRPPYFILTMIAVIVLVHECVSRDAHASLEWLPGAWWREPWRLLTYGCVHASHGHLALNALVALAVGWPLEREQGWCRAAAVWWCGVCCGALGAGALQPRLRVVGASAAVYAMLTAHLPNVCLRFGHIPLWWFRPLSVVVLCASEACWAAVQAGGGGGAGAGGPHVAWAAHLCGAALGAPLGFLVFTGENRSSRVLLAARVVSAAALASGAALAVAHYACWQHLADPAPPPAPHVPARRH